MKQRRIIVNLMLAVLVSTGLMFQVSCNEKDSPGKIMLRFNHNVGGYVLLKDTMIYTNIAGDHYEVNELQYFISEFTLWKEGHPYIAVSGQSIHYVDIEIPATLEWNPDTEFPSGSYDSVTFIFGLNKEMNQSGLFVNPPERDMFWPDVMGGGYHYMKMNGKWLSDGGIENPFNLHLGIGMVMDGNGDEEFVHNYFSVSLPLDNCYIDGDLATRRFDLSMNLNAWFDTPVLWDWDVIGGQIMQNQEAMNWASMNGHDAFSVYYTSSN